MSNKVDKLFKEKLGEHSLPPSAQAWGKIEANLAKKNKGIVWFRIAAVIALAGLLTFVWVKNEKDTLPQMANHDPVTTEKEQPAQLKEKEEKEVQQEQQERPSVAHQTAKEKKSNPTSKKKKQPIIEPENVSTKTNNEQPAVAWIEEKKEELPATNEVTTEQVKNQKSIKLTFSLPSLKTDTQEPEQAVALTPEEKKSTLQKAVNDIRTGDVLGSLRDAKDDLFAWDFKKDKTKKTTLN